MNYGMYCNLLTRKIQVVICTMCVFYLHGWAQTTEWYRLHGTEGKLISAMTMCKNNPDTMYFVGKGFFRSIDRGNHWDSLSNKGGPSCAIKTDPYNAKIIYLSSPGPDQGNDISISTDGGYLWKKVFGGSQCSSPFIEIDPSDRKTVYVGYAPSAIMKSSDYGMTWEAVNVPYIPCINDFKISPINDSVMYIASAYGIYKSIDKGNSWTLTGFSYYAHYLAVSPTNSEIVFSGIASEGENPRGVYKTTDGGISWDQINNGLDGLEGREWGILAITINPENPEHVFVGTHSLTNKIFYQSTDGGAVWKPFYKGLPDSAGVRCIMIDTTRNKILIGVNGGGIYSNDVITEIKEDRVKTEPNEIQLFQNYPNPFNPVTLIRYQLPTATDVKLSIYNLLGQEMRVLVNEKQTAGNYSVMVDASQYPSGVYFYTLETTNFTATQKMILIR